MGGLKVFWADFGMIEYELSFKLQLLLSKRVKEEKLDGFVLFAEHPPTITLGYSLKGDEGKTQLRLGFDELKKKGIKVFQVDRGGKATYHGPGQLVCYPILSLNRFRLSTKRYVHFLEDVVLNWLLKMGINAYRDELYPGVWVEGKKIAAIGVRIEDRISRHGFAINLEVDLEPFNYIIPCGIQERGVCSLNQICEEKITRGSAIAGLVDEFKKVFQTDMVNVAKESLLPDEEGLNDNKRMVNARAI